MVRIKVLEMRDKFIDLLKSSALVQGTIALCVVIGMVYLYVTGKPVPDTMVGIAMAILGYYFGTKSQQISNQNLEAYATQYGYRTNSGTSATIGDGKSDSPSTEGTNP